MSDKEELINELTSNLDFVRERLEKAKFLLKEYNTLLKRAEKEGKFYLKSENKFWATAEIRGKAAAYENIIYNAEITVKKISEGIEKLETIEKVILNDLEILKSVDNE